MSIDRNDDAASLTGRRDLLRNLAGGAVALASLGTVACASATSAAPAAGSRPTPGPAQQQGTGAFDMSWLGRIDKRRRTVFDTYEVSGGAGLAYVGAYLSGAAQAYGPDIDASTVLVHRHASVPVVIGDDVWKRLALGESLKINDPTTGEPALRNPFINYKQGDRHSMTGANGGLDTLIAKGVIVLACNIALGGYASRLATKESIPREEARKQLMASLVPGVYVVPNGIFGVCAAQEANCAYIAVR
jgi:intracellular sulfur oxidation DsrE/DsrF family protein